VGRKNSTPSIGCHGQGGGTRPVQERKTPKDLSLHESEDRECGESVGFNGMLCTSVNEEGGDGEAPRSEGPEHSCTCRRERPISSVMHT
jgi:hypothetical protein